MQIQEPVLLGISSESDFSILSDTQFKDAFTQTDVEYIDAFTQVLLESGALVFPAILYRYTSSLCITAITTASILSFLSYEIYVMLLVSPISVKKSDTIFIENQYALSTNNEKDALLQCYFHTLTANIFIGQCKDIKLLPKPQEPVLLEFALPEPQEPVLLEFALPKPQEPVLLEFALPKPQEFALQKFALPKPQEFALQKFALPKPQEFALQNKCDTSFFLPNIPNILNIPNIPNIPLGLQLEQKLEKVETMTLVENEKPMPFRHEKHYKVTLSSSLTFNDTIPLYIPFLHYTTFDAFINHATFTLEDLL